MRALDDIQLITEMLHDAYAPLAMRGMRFVASHQDAATTQERMERGETIVAEEAGAIVGTITLKDAAQTFGSPFYERKDVAGFGQLAVRPSHQGHGIGSALIILVEQLAAERGIAHVGLDTSEHASELIRLYESKGYAFVEYIQWPNTNYRSVIMAKRTCTPMSSTITG